MKTCHADDSARFLAGGMTAAEVCAFEVHLEACSDCRHRLEQEAGDDEAWQSVHKLLGFRSDRPDVSSLSWQALAEEGEAETARRWSCTSTLLLAVLAPSDDPAIVGRLGPYEVLGLIGRGSAGIVVKGFDRALNRNVAIKLLDPSLADVGTARQRFAREARAMAAISHEHVVPVYEVSEHAGLPYFVMEYIPGGSLERRLQADGPLDTLSVVRIGWQVAQALAEAHGQGLVHRDIKPGNILLDRGTERVRVADFGLVHAVNDASFTRSGFVAGTPQYMAPEQVRAETCDGRSDLFSLGAVMYALCTGHPPFRAETVYGVMQQVVQEVPPSIRAENLSVPLWLESFILRLLAKNRAARFDSANVVAQALQAELAHLQSPSNVAVPPRSWIGLPNKTVRRRRTAIAIVVAIGLAAAAFAVVKWLDNDGAKDVHGAGQPVPAHTGASASEASRSVPPWGDELERVKSEWERFEERAQRDWDSQPVTEKKTSQEPEQTNNLTTEGANP